MNTEIKVHNEKPEGFLPKVEVAASYVNLNGKLLLLELASHKQEAGLWGVPAGKLESDEIPVKGAKRELFEETGIDISLDDFHSLGALYISKPDFDYTYHIFSVNLNTEYPVSLSAEHTSYKWVLPTEAKSLPLMNGANQALDAYYQHSSKKKWSGAFVNVYLILRKENVVLLHLRKNTGYCDGYYGLVAGHVEDGESAISAMVREAYEEAGILIHPSDLKAVHTMHRQTNRLNIDLFFECQKWQGTITNREPQKCSKLEFFSLERLPLNIIDYIKDGLEAALNQNFYSESGWNS